jgi:hypothetical protein
MLPSSLLLLLPLLLAAVAAYPEFASRIPNGGDVPGAPELGHVVDDWPERNAFGQDFDDAGRDWTVEFCRADSDGDGQTNGQELGDPCCQWDEMSGDSPMWSDGLSHPGDRAKMSDASRWENLDCNGDAKTDL